MGAIYKRRLTYQPYNLRAPASKRDHTQSLTGWFFKKILPTSSTFYSSLLYHGNNLGPNVNDINTCVIWFFLCGNFFFWIGISKLFGCVTDYKYHHIPSYYSFTEEFPIAGEWVSILIYKYRSTIRIDKKWKNNKSNNGG